MRETVYIERGRRTGNGLQVKLAKCLDGADPMRGLEVLIVLLMAQRLSDRDAEAFLGQCIEVWERADLESEQSAFAA